MSQIITTNPATGEQLATFDMMTADHLNELLSIAHKGFAQWSRRPLNERVAVVRRISELYRERLDDLAYDVAQEMGKPLAAAKGELKTVISIYDYYADNAETLLQDEPIAVQGTGQALLRTAPLGVVLGIMPWNFPHYQVARFVAPNLVLGNTVVLKHATVCAQTATNIAAIMADAGAVDGVYTNIFGSHHDVENMIFDDRIAGVSLTGSEGAGQRIGSLAGEAIKPAVLELGGSDPFIVTADADIEAAARDAVVARCNNAGQQCTGGKRFLIDDSVYDEFMERFIAGMEAVKVGDPLADGTVMGPLSSAGSLRDLQTQVDQAVEDGATVLLGGKPLDGPGNYYPPTVLSNVTPENRAYYQELFGPVAMVFRVNSFDEAIELANDSPFGLSSAIYTQDDEKVARAFEEIETGMVYVNTPSKSAAELPFGGVKRSGIGRELGTLGIEEFANKKLLRRA